MLLENTTSGLSILMHGDISLPGATSYNNTDKAVGSSLRDKSRTM